MKRIFAALLTLIVITSCQNTDPANRMHLQGKIRGLKKGTVYLEQLRDSVVAVDSVELFGSGEFEFTYELEEPEMMHIYLKKKDENIYNDRYPFFAEPGELYFRADLDRFERSARLIGSRSDSLYRGFQSMISSFYIRDVELTQSSMQSDSTAVDSLIALQNKNGIARIRYTLNFAFSNPESAVAPYAVITEAREANPVLLDSLWNILGEEARASLYGKDLRTFIDNRKKDGWAR